MKERYTAMLLGLSLTVGLGACGRAPLEEESTYTKACGVTKLILQTDDATVTGSANDSYKYVRFCVTPKDKKPQDLASTFFNLTKSVGCNTAFEIATTNSDTGKKIDVYDVSMSDKSGQKASECLQKVIKILEPIEI